MPNGNDQLKNVSKSYYCSILVTTIYYSAQLINMNV